jgi:type II secretory pathway component PulF
LLSALAVLEKGAFVENLSTLASSGMGVSQALNSVVSDLKPGPLKNIGFKMIEELDGGSPLFRAMEHSGIFNDNIISLVRIGEETGKLKENLRVVAMQEQKENEFNNKVRSAMVYPGLVLMTTIGVGIGISWFILPKLTSVFSSMHMQLPLITKWLLAFANFLSVNGAVAVPAIIGGLALAFYLIFVFPKTKFIGQAIVFSFPGSRNLMIEIEMARFGFLLGTLLKAGVAIDTAIESLRKSTDFFPYQKYYSFMRDRISEGDSFSQIFRKNKGSRTLIPMPVQRMVVSAEQSANLSEVMI